MPDRSQTSAAKNDSSAAPPTPIVGTPWALAILNDAADGILTIDAHGIIQWANPAAGKTFGYDTTDLVGRNVSVLMPPPDRDRHDHYIEHYLHTGEKKIIGLGREVVGRRSDGSTFPLYLSVCESRVNGATIFGGIVRDLTERRRIEGDLRRERDFNRRLLDTAAAIVLVLDARGRIVQFNRHLERLAGRRLADVRERDWFETFVPERDRERTRWLFRQAAGGRIARGIVYPIVTDGGQERQIEWFESPLETGQDVEGGLLCVGLDVTERVAAEQARVAYEAKLRLLTAELISSEERARSALAAELHDRLGQIMALAKIKLGALHDAAPVELRGAVSEIRELVNDAVRSTRSMTAEIGATTLHELGLEPALADLADETRSRHGLACTFADDGRTKPLPDETKFALFRAVRELLINVVKHANARRCEVAVRRDGATICVRVSDDGTGFSVPQAGFHTSKAGSFGLFSIQERLSGLGGSLTVVSAPGRGTIATLEAPLARDAPSEADA